ncbi:sugar kinase [Actinomadura sp. NBRC 104412]|uniref:ROK family protein n=1 Tax=Actinomadura sp. NBRC 104412 TaxID=3032203 RepID=UPI0024A3BDFD|nr:ROK family protein [Actinomadura sp. NBRC 104412]GLZ04948.1 sugar kinase [Actinomadura sp. NBRC 104412]
MSDRGSEVPVLAIDIGGTKMAAAMVGADGRLTAHERVETPNRPIEHPDPETRSRDAEAIWAALDALVGKVLAAAGADAERIAGVGVGCGGPMTWPAAEVSPLNMRAWRGFPLRDRLRARFPGLPVRVHNDAVCVAIAEHWQGAGKGYGNVLGMVVSTGVGGGLVLGGRLIDGKSGNAGHVGHIVVDPDGPPCGCGGRGCLEAIARGPGLTAWAREQGWRRDDERDPTGVDLAADARAGHPVAMAAMRRAGRALGIALASTANVLDLDVVAIGGGLSQAGDLLFGPLEEAFAVHARMDFARRVRIVPATLGQTSGLIGAAALIQRPDLYWGGDDR